MKLSEMHTQTPDRPSSSLSTSASPRQTRQNQVKITPTPITAALAGLFSALLLPFVWSQFGGSAAAGSMELIVAVLLVVALPAHAFVIGFSRSPMPTARTLHTALLKRIGAWLAAAAATVVIAQIVRTQ
jgi:hypothetical protein